MRKCAVALLLMSAMGLASMSAGAKDESCVGSNSPCCDRCGCHCDCLQKVCQIVCEPKAEIKKSWCVESQEIGLLMPGRRDCCDDCPPPPRCGRTKCVQKLVKKECKVEVPAYKCVVRYMCPTCVEGTTAGAAHVAPTQPSAPRPAPTPAPAQLPAPPKRSAK
ncbi:MAG: hypothetical protein LLG00_10555 [Planctomycetaceae bacterium]|nr:hypothetical protein [Planctomycetaceae bacterium]